MPNECEFLRDCRQQIVKDYFNNICYTTLHINCMHWAKRKDRLGKPMEWLQKLAVTEYLSGQKESSNQNL